MINTNQEKEYILNASNFTLGRLTTKIVLLLRGKNNPNFAPNKLSNNKVVVYNFNKVKITGNKLKQKIYYRHSGYPGGLKSITLENLFKKNPEKVLRMAVMGMLPKNKLRSKMIKNLKVYEGELSKK